MDTDSNQAFGSRKSLGIIHQVGERFDHQKGRRVVIGQMLDKDAVSVGLGLMGEPFGILFLHHEVNEVTRNNLASVQRQNPTATIVTMSAGEPLPGGYSLDATPEWRARHSRRPRTGADWLVCSWMVQRREAMQGRWWIIEWDVFCTMPAREYYRSVWHEPFVATCVKLQHDDRRWPWFRGVRKMPPELRQHAMGAVPFLYLMDDELLRKVCATLLGRPILAGNCELRFATISNALGFAPVAFNPVAGWIDWRPLHRLPGTKGIFHPVKFHAGTSGADHQG